MEIQIMNTDTQQNQLNEAEEIQFYKETIRALIENLNDVDILKSIAHYTFKISFDRKD